LCTVCRLPEDELQTSLSRLVASELVSQRGTPPDSVYSFKHALVQDTAYSTLLRGPRQALHRRIAEALEQRFPDFVETRPEIVAYHYGEAAIADKAIAYWHRAGKLSVARSAVREAIAQLRRGLSLLEGLPETRERKQLELDIHVTLTQALMAGKGYADPEVFAALERANRLVIETGSVGTPLHFLVLYGLWVSTVNTGTVVAGLEHATNFLSSAQSQSSSGPLLIGHRSLAQSLMVSGDYPAALAHYETAVSLYRPDEHRDSAFRYGQDIGVSAFAQLSWALWHRGYPDQSARAADRALALSRNWDMPTPLPTPLRGPAGPRSSPEMSPPSTPAATSAWRSRANTDSPYGRPMAGFSRAGPTPKGVKRRRELPASATVWPRPRRPAPA